MKVYIANFGKGNYAWKKCKAMPSVASMNIENVQEFWEKGDKQGYINYLLDHAKTALGKPIPKQLASRWFNLMTIVSETNDDIWIHRDHSTLWWAKTTAKPANITKVHLRHPTRMEAVYECHKPCTEWRNKDGAGRKLNWDSLHPKAKDFLSTESTLQELSEDNAKYALSLINGEDLSTWHNNPKWKERQSTAKTTPVKASSSREISIGDMAYQAETTSKNANGQTVERKIKNKNFVFNNTQELEEYLKDILESQQDRCALSGLPLQFKGTHDDEEMLCSLDRIDSDGHYEPGNLQIVCRFINFWKRDSKNEEFSRLLEEVRKYNS